MTELPRGWEWATVDDLCELNPRHFDDPLTNDDSISFVPMSSVEAESGRLDASRVVRYGDLKQRSLTPFQEDDVIFAKITPCMENGKIAHARGLWGARALGSTEFFVMRSYGAIVPRFLMYYLLQRSVRDEAERNMTGAVGQRRVPRTYFADLAVPLPPLGEQHRIVEVVEEYMSRLESARSLLDKSRMRTFGLERRVRHHEMSHLTGRPVQNLGELLDEPLRNGHSARASTDGTGVRTLTLTAVTTGKFEDSNTKLTIADRDRVKDLWLKPGDILIQRSNTVELVGSSALYLGQYDWAIFPDLLIRVRVNGDVMSEYVAFVLASPGVRRYFRGAAKGLAGSMPKIDQGTILRTLIPIPPLSVQKSVVEHAEDMFSHIARLRDQATSALSRSLALRSALFSAAFSGRLVPQDPADEPAAVLLDRIRAERAATSKPRRGRRAATTTTPEELPL